MATKTKTTTEAPPEAGLRVVQVEAQNFLRLGYVNITFEMSAWIDEVARKTGLCRTEAVRAMLQVHMDEDQAEERAA